MPPLCRSEAPQCAQPLDAGQARGHFCKWSSQTTRNGGDCQVATSWHMLFVLALLLQAPKPSPGPHKTRECLPLVLLLRNRLK